MIYQAVCPLESGVSLSLAREAYIEDHEDLDSVDIERGAHGFDDPEANTVHNFFNR